MKIRTRAILVIILTNFLIILLSILAGTVYARENIEKYIETDMLVVADIADRFISSELDMLRAEAGEIAESLAAEEPEGWERALSEQAGLFPKFESLMILTSGFSIAHAAGLENDAVGLGDVEAVQRAFQGETAISSTVQTPSGTVFYIAAPIPGDAGHILVLTLDGMYFSELVSEFTVWETGHIFIDDSEGYVIANIREEWVQNRENFIIRGEDDPQYGSVAEVVRKLTAGERGVGYYPVNGEPRICAYRPISNSYEGWALGIVAPLTESPVRNFDGGLFLIGAVAVLLNVAAAVIASGFIKKPFEESAALRERAENNLREIEEMVEELKRRDEQLQSALADAERANSAKSDFLAHMSHEIRTPLNAVIGLSELTLGEERLSVESESNLEKISVAGSTILSIVNDILDISKIESGKLEIYPLKYDTPSMINDVVTLNIVRIGEKPIEFKLTVDEKLPGALFGDDLRVKQIFNNLLSNAFKYTNAGTVEWRITYEREGDSVWLVSDVSDTGIGIEAESLEKLFTDYNQVDISANRRVEGTGLGLAIAKRLAELMDGDITVDSEYGKGSVFHVRLRHGFVSETPIGKAVAGNLMGLRYTLSKRDKITKPARVDLSYARVLIVDDIATNLDVVKGMLKPYGVKVDCAVSGRQSIDMIRTGEPVYDAVFMDHMMPGMDGVETLRRIREDIGTQYARNLPVIALTANAVVGNEEMFRSRGFQDFISKPIDISKLDAVLRRWVRDKSKEKERAEETGGGAAQAAGHDENTDGAADGVPIEIGGVDCARALERFSGDKGVLIDVLRTYARDTRLLMGKLGEYLEAGNSADYTITVHGIKGSSYGIFAENAGRAAEALEAASKAGGTYALSAGHLAFEKLMEALLGGIDRALADFDANTNKPISSSPDPEIIEELRAACAAFDMDGADAAMNKLEAYSYESGGEIVAWLRGRVSEMAFEEIAGGDWRI